MFRIVDNRVLDLTVTVPSSRSGELAIGQKLSFTVDAVPGRTFEGVVRFINPTVDAASRTVSVTAEVANDRGRAPGRPVRQGADRHRQPRGRAVRAARRAAHLGRRPSAPARCYVIDGDVAWRRSITLGAACGDVVEVASGSPPASRSSPAAASTSGPATPSVVTPEGA